MMLVPLHRVLHRGLCASPRDTSSVLLLQIAASHCQRNSRRIDSSCRLTKGLMTDSTCWVSPLKRDMGIGEDGWSATRRQGGPWLAS